MPAQITTRCCIVGGGPAGVMTGLLLARSGVDVLVLEKHADFFRDFRGGTIHPSTLELLAELGMDQAFLALAHQKVEQLKLSFNGQTVIGPDLSRLKLRHPFIALIPQWDFLTFLAEQARHYPGFHMEMNAEAVDLIRNDGKIAGVEVDLAGQRVRVAADLVIAADGRDSTLRRCAGMTPTDYGIAIDVLWFRLPAPASDPGDFLGRVENQVMLVTLPRGDYYQCAMIIAKGAFAQLRQRGLDRLREDIVSAAPPLAGVVDSLRDWNQVKLLTVQIDRLERWYQDGLLCIGDAAHAMSPAGGVGINLAIQDAVATANLLATTLAQEGSVTEADLVRVQRRREPAVRRIQALQVFLHRRLFSTKGGLSALNPPWLLRQTIRIAAPVLRRLGARIIGIGFRAEHIESLEHVHDKTAP